MVWGHSWEFKDVKRWNDFNKFCREAGNRKDIWYVGCGEFIEYQLTLKKLKITEGIIVNPKGNKEVWFKQDGLLKVLKPGERMKAQLNQVII